jgi:2-polyprenyl-3-methyl-5-hydroxy-6-metoxy-1,4-benzoquinol methylase
MLNNQQDHEISTFPLPNCLNCGAKGLDLYHGLKDLWFGSPGTWNLKRCPNVSCGLAWLDPMPSPEDIGKAYKTYYTHAEPIKEISKKKSNLLSRTSRYLKNGYLAQCFNYPSAVSSWQKLVGLLILLLPKRRGDLIRSINGIKWKSGGRLLDVGCGGGEFLAFMKSLGWQVEGVELDHVAAKQAISMGIKVPLGTLEEQGYPDNHFAAISLIHVIEHVHNPFDLLRECFRILQPGGQLAIITPNLGSWGHRLFQEAWRGLEPPRHLFLYSHNPLREVAQKAGFIIRSLTSIPQRASWICGVSRIMSRKIRNRKTPISLKADKLMQHAFFWLEWGLIKIRSYVGEELFLVGEK